MSHGGDVDRVSRQTGIPVERILDFSANVNPAGLPQCARDRLARDAQNPRLWMHYPDPEATDLRRALAAKLQVPVDSIVVGAGADALIHAAIRALAPRRCIIPVPAFSEYERACRAFGCAIACGAGDRFVSPAPGGAWQATNNDGLPHSFRIDVIEPGDLVILNNPHNPTGRGASQCQVLEWVRQVREAGGTVLADEAFVDYLPEAAITREAASMHGVVSIRSLTKFYGCPGLRVGYAVAHPETIREIVAKSPGWPVTALALHVIAAALEDEEYARATLETNVRARALLVNDLERLSCQVFPPAANFILFSVPGDPRAAEIRERLIRDHAILVRDCDSFEGLERGRFLRVAVRKESENQRLIEALANVMAGLVGQAVSPAL